MSRDRRTVRAMLTVTLAATAALTVAPRAFAATGPPIRVVVSQGWLPFQGTLHNVLLPGGGFDAVSFIDQQIHVVTQVAFFADATTETDVHANLAAATGIGASGLLYHAVGSDFAQFMQAGPPILPSFPLSFVLISGPPIVPGEIAGPPIAPQPLLVTLQLAFTDFGTLTGGLATVGGRLIRRFDAGTLAYGRGALWSAATRRRFGL